VVGCGRGKATKGKRELERRRKSEEKGLVFFFFVYSRPRHSCGGGALYNIQYEDLSEDSEGEPFRSRC